MSLFGKMKIAPEPENFVARVHSGTVVLSWKKPKGSFSGYIIFAGFSDQEMQGIDRIHDKGVSEFVVRDPIRGEMYAVATFKGARISELVFSSLDEEPVFAGDNDSGQSETQAGTVQSLTEQEDSAEQDREDVCLSCEGKLSWGTVKEGKRDREVLKCENCGFEYIVSVKGRLFRIDKLEYGFCKCLECLRKQILVLSGDRVVCSKTGTEYVFVQSGVVVKVSLATSVKFGFCRCCIPHQPLKFQNENYVCSAKPDVVYVRIGTSDQFEMRLPGQSIYWSGGDPRRRLLEGDLNLGRSGLPV